MRQRRRWGEESGEIWETEEPTTTPVSIPTSDASRLLESTVVPSNRASSAWPTYTSTVKTFQPAPSRQQPKGRGDPCFNLYQFGHYRAQCPRLGGPQYPICMHVDSGSVGKARHHISNSVMDDNHQSYLGMCVSCQSGAVDQHQINLYVFIRSIVLVFQHHQPTSEVQSIDVCAILMQMLIKANCMSRGLFTW